jgi:hypothetical protein
MLSTSFVALAAALVLSLLSASLAIIVNNKRRRSSTSSLPGPPRPSWLVGFERLKAEVGPAVLYRAWNEQYGSVVEIPMPLGSKAVLVFDPTAAAHFYAKDTYGYRNLSLANSIIERLVRSLEPCLC